MATVMGTEVEIVKQGLWPGGVSGYFFSENNFAFFNKYFVNSQLAIITAGHESSHKTCTR